MLTFFGFLQLVLGTFFCLQKLLDSLRLAGHAGCWGWCPSAGTGARRELYTAAKPFPVFSVCRLLQQPSRLHQTSLLCPDCCWAQRAAGGTREMQWLGSQGRSLLLRVTEASHEHIGEEENNAPSGL